VVRFYNPRLRVRAPRLKLIFAQSHLHFLCQIDSGFRLVRSRRFQMVCLMKGFGLFTESEDVGCGLDAAVGLGGTSPCRPPTPPNISVCTWRHASEQL